VPRPLRVGIQLPEVERDVRWPEIVAMARAAEEVGFDSVWLGDHLLYRDDGRPERGPWDAWSMLAALAASTTRVRLGPLVACLSFHPPGILARTAAAVDEISGGRLVLGVGAGWNPEEFRAFGLPFDHRVDRFAEAFDVVRRLLSGERASLRGRYWRLEDAVLLPALARRPTLMIGSTGERMLGIGLPHVDAWNTWYREIENTIEGFEAASAIVTAAARGAGRDPAEIGRSVCVFVVLDRGATERPIDVEPVPPERVADHLRALADAGASEAILVASPITEASVRSLAAALDRLDR
jgi:alkanesulfonate monooxygenase SsuD/methylene tetrahydromethanopterin reductase-like flavin-dependent oxidoreductase (luciferase family)